MILRVPLQKLYDLAALDIKPRADFHIARRSAITSPADVAERARAYLARIPGATSGQRGHDRTFYAANRLIRGFALTPEAALPLFEEWNQKCDPPWSDEDLIRKLEQASRVPGPRGFLLNENTPPPGARPASSGTDAAIEKPQFCNYVWDEYIDGETTRRVRRGRGGEELVDELVAFTGGWPRRMGGVLFAIDRHGRIWWIENQSGLFAWIDWQYRFDGGRGYDWACGQDCLNHKVFLSACQTHCENWKQVELYPHEPSIPNHYYHHPEITAGDGKHLNQLVDFFSPASEIDGDLIRLLFLSLCWGGPPGKRPLFMIESSSDSKGGGRGAGKTTLATMAASLVGGFISISPDEPINEINSRLLSPRGLECRVGLIDNLKSLRFSSSSLERLVTSDVISGKQMYVGESRRPNTLQWIITSNMPSLSKDLAQRSVIVRVTTPVYDPDWQDKVRNYIEEHRWQIIGDIVAELRSEGNLPEGYQFSRWSEWETQVMSKAPEPGSLAVEIFARQATVDDDRETGEEIADEIRELLERFGFNPDKDAVLIPSEVVYQEVIKKFCGPNMSKSASCKWFHTLGIEGIKKQNRRRPYRGVIWDLNSVSDDEIKKWP
jgi:hypothetical protein